MTAIVILLIFMFSDSTAAKSIIFINGTNYKSRMEDQFDAIPAPYKTERLGRMRDLIMQIEADYERYDSLKQIIDAGSGNEAHLEELHTREAWMKRSMITFRRLNAMSIEGITFLRIGEFSSLSCPKKQ